MSLIVVEGLDGSGKATQTKLLFEKLSEKNKVSRISFPDYNCDSSALVKMYLGGKFGKDPNCVNPYAASSFYAVDRFASFMQFWKEDYENNVIILADRYATSNMIYQASKLPENERESFIRWIEDFEYSKLGLPSPDLVIYLDMLPEISQKLLSGRYGGDDSKKDIHEKDVSFLKKCRENALFAAKLCSWQVIGCYEGEKPLSIEKIHERVLAAAMQVV